MKDTEQVYQTVCETKEKERRGWKRQVSLDKQEVKEEEEGRRKLERHLLRHSFRNLLVRTLFTFSVSQCDACPDKRLSFLLSLPSSVPLNGILSGQKASLTIPLTVVSRLLTPFTTSSLLLLLVDHHVPLFVHHASLFVHHVLFYLPFELIHSLQRSSLIFQTIREQRIREKIDNLCFFLFSSSSLLLAKDSVIKDFTSEG